MLHSALINVMVKAARRAGRSLKRDLGEIENLQVSMKGPANFVTAADKRAEQMLYDDLLKARPGYGFVGEEGGTREGTDKSNTWIVDPLDGTTNFLHGIPQFAISIGLQREGVMIAGVIYNPANDELYIAERGKGASCNGNTLVTSPSDTLQSARLAGNASAFKKLEASGVAKMEMSFTPQILRLCMIAEGSADVLVAHGPKNDWDVAAGVLLAQEAGAKVTTESGVVMKFNQPHPKQPGMVAAHPQRHALMMKFMEQL